MCRGSRRLRRFRMIQACPNDSGLSQGPARAFVIGGKCGETGCTGCASHVRHETPRVHHAARQRDCRMAARGTCTAGGNAGDRTAQQPFARCRHGGRNLRIDYF